MFVICSGSLRNPQLDLLAFPKEGDRSLAPVRDHCLAMPFNSISDFRSKRSRITPATEIVFIPDTGNGLLQMILNPRNFTDLCTGQAQNSLPYHGPTFWLEAASG